MSGKKTAQGIEVRKVPFEFPSDFQPHWHSDDPALSQLINGTSILLPYMEPFIYMGAGGNTLLDFFTVPMQSAITASVLFDLLIAFAAFNVLLFAEGRTLGSRNFTICLLVSWLVAFAAGLPLFLFLRERQKRSG